MEDTELEKALEDARSGQPQPPPGFTATVMRRIGAIQSGLSPWRRWRRGRQATNFSRAAGVGSNQSQYGRPAAVTGGATVSKKILWGVVGLGSTAAIAMFFLGIPPIGDGTAGTIGAAKRFQGAAMSDKDVVTGPMAVQTFMQSETFDRILKNAALRNVLVKVSKDAKLQKAFSDPALIEMFKKPGFVEMLTDAAFHEAFTDAAFLEMFKKPGFQEMFTDAAFLKALGEPSLQSMMKKPAFMEAMSNPAFAEALKKPGFVEMLQEPAFVEALSDAAFMDAMAEPAFVDAMAEPAFMDALAEPAFIEMLAEPAFIEAFKKPGFMEALIGDAAFQAALKKQ